MKKNKIGENAGIIWNVLNENGEMTITELKQATKLNEIDFHLALGWLSREHKVMFWGENKDDIISLSEN